MTFQTKPLDAHPTSHYVAHLISSIHIAGGHPCKRTGHRLLPILAGNVEGGSAVLLPGTNICLKLQQSIRGIQVSIFGGKVQGALAELLQCRDVRGRGCKK